MRIELPAGDWPSFDALEDDAIVVAFIAHEYTGAPIKLRVQWTAAAATAGAVRWAAQVAAVTPNTDNIAALSAPFGVRAGVTSPHLGGVADRLHEALIELGAVADVVAGDWVRARVLRAASNIEDTMPSTARVVALVIESD